MRFPLRRAMTVLALLGIALATYLTIVHYAGLKPACTAGQACIRVQTSQWSQLDGVPVALIGLLGYIMILGALVAPDREETRLAVLGLTMVGFGFSAYLTYRELFSIHAICEECATSAVFMTILLICAVYRYLTTNDG
ncbi:MAG TPA: vitamin K epoxide reductase family protein, partial [Solirubrobacteraceae bacterium]|nr:vitamin K epoxide reductase family protein [Solirubrobacteraceae bacterium]